MAGVGIKLHRLIEKRPAAAGLTDMAYCCVLPVAALLLAGVMLLLERMLGLRPSQGPFSYILGGSLIFPLLALSPFSAVLPKYLQDALCAGCIQDIRPAYRAGLALAILLGCLMGIPLCLRASFAGGALAPYVPAGFCCSFCLTLALYSLLYPLGFREYGKTAFFFLAGLLVAFPLALLLRFAAGREAGWSILLALSAGFALTALLGYSSVRRHFAADGGGLWPVVRYCGRHWPMLLSQLFYALGLCIPYVALGAAGRHTWAKAVDGAAAYFAMLPHAPALLLFAARAERRLHSSYLACAHALAGGRLTDICQAKRGLCRELFRQYRDFARDQLILSACACLLFALLGSCLGFSDTAMRLYLRLSAASLILVQVYVGMLLLYYFNDLGGALLTAGLFCLVTILGALLAVRLPDIGYGPGLLSGALAGWAFGYLRLGWAARHVEARLLCGGALQERGWGPRPPDQVFVKAAESPRLP